MQTRLRNALSVVVRAGLCAAIALSFTTGGVLAHDDYPDKDLTPYAADRESMHYLTKSCGNHLFSSWHQNRKVGTH